jgi:phosphoglycolate phosphatase-like HAD superfamily hydrolase
MSSTASVVTFSPRDYDAVLFDLDGVLTKTTSVHAAARKSCSTDFSNSAQRIQAKHSSPSTLMPTIVAMHLAAFELALTAENWSAKVTMRSAINGRVVNAAAKLYRKFTNKHLDHWQGTYLAKTRRLEDITFRDLRLLLL